MEATRWLPTDASARWRGDNMLQPGVREGGRDDQDSPRRQQQVSIRALGGVYSGQHTGLPGQLGSGAGNGKKKKTQANAATGPEAGPSSTEAGRLSRTGHRESEAALGGMGRKEERLVARDHSGYGEVDPGQHQAAGLSAVAHSHAAGMEALIGTEGRTQLQHSVASTRAGPASAVGSGTGVEYRAALGLAADRDVDGKARESKRTLLLSDLPPGCAPSEVKLFRQPNRDSSRDRVGTDGDLPL